MRNSRQITVEPESCLFQAGPTIPNNPFLPVLVYRGITHDIDKAAEFERRFSENGWQGLWRNGIYDYHHFHSTAHEVLGIAAGKVSVVLGGETGRNFSLDAGDMAVLPAGTGHMSLESSDDLMVIGAYPPGQSMDICRSLKDCPRAIERIAQVDIPKNDPFFGSEGPLRKFWDNEP